MSPKRELSKVNFGELFWGFYDKDLLHDLVRSMLQFREDTSPIIATVQWLSWCVNHLENNYLENSYQFRCICPGGGLTLTVMDTMMVGRGGQFSLSANAISGWMFLNKLH